MVHRAGSVQQKPMKVLFLFANSSVRKGLADPDALQRLMEQAIDTAGYDMQMYVSYARSLSFFVSNAKTKIRDHRNHMNLDEYDFVYFRKAGSAMQQMLTCALYLRDHNVPFFDTEIIHTNSRNKLSQMYMLHRNGISIPTTLYCRNNRRLLRLVNTRYKKRFEYPVIAKATGGTRGDANYLIHNSEELSRLLSTEHRHFLIQSFVPNTGDMRLFVSGGVLSGAILRQSTGESHLNNTSKGASATLIPLASLSRAIKYDAVAAAQVFGRDCAGVDVITDMHTGDHYVLEVNRAPQIEGASFEHEKASWVARSIHAAIRQSRYEDRRGDNPRIFGWLEAAHLVLSEDSHSKLIAKIDTGAYSSSVHALDAREENGLLYCTIARESIEFRDYSKKRVKSSNGMYADRYIVTMPVIIGDEQYNMKVTLNNRSDMNYDMLLGRKFLRAYKIKVDVGRRYIASGKKKTEVIT